MLDGKPVFLQALSNQPKCKYRVAADQKLPPGKHTFTFDFAYDGGASIARGLARRSHRRMRRTAEGVVLDGSQGVEVVGTDENVSSGAVLVAADDGGGVEGSVVGEMFGGAEMLAAVAVDDVGGGEVADAHGVGGSVWVDAGLAP